MDGGAAECFGFCLDDLLVLNRIVSPPGARNTVSAFWPLCLHLFVRFNSPASRSKMASALAIGVGVATAAFLVSSAYASAPVFGPTSRTSC